MRRDPEREPDDRERPRRGPVRRILWRRRAWGWIAVLGLAGYLILAATLLIEVTTPGGVGPGAESAGTAAEWLAVAVGAGTLGVLAESRLLGRHKSADRAGLPPRSSPAGWLGVLAALGFAMALMMFPVWALPGTVNAWGYAMGAEPSATFVATHSYQECSSDNGGDETCSWLTDGYLERGHQHVVWPGSVAAGQTLQVSAPLWDWLSGDRLINGGGTVAGDMVLGFIAGFTLLCALATGGGTAVGAVRLARDKTP